MKKIMTIWFVAAAALLASGGAYHVGEAGSEMYSFKVKLVMDLIKPGGGTVPLLDGSKYIETKCEGSTTCVADQLETTAPPAGTYTGVAFKVIGFQYKAKLVVGGTAYYTTDETVKHGDAWHLSTDPAKLGLTTVTYDGSDIPGGEGNRISFGKELNVSEGGSASLAFINQFMKEHIEYDTESDMHHVTRISESEVALAITPTQPAKKITFDIVYDGTGGAAQKHNTMTVFLNSHYEILSAFMQRLENSAIEGSFFMRGKKDGQTRYLIDIQNSLDSKFGDIGDDYYRISVDLDCDTHTYDHLAIAVYSNGSGGSTPPSSDYTLQTSGTITCEDIPAL